MTEHEALTKIGAKDWRSLNKNQIMTFLFEAAPNLSDEIRLKILETAPDILSTAKSFLSEYQETAKKILEGNQQISEKILDHNNNVAEAICTGLNKAIETLGALLSDPNASFEEKKHWNAELSKYIQMLYEYGNKNQVFLVEQGKENKGFWQNLMQQYGGVAAGALGGLLAGFFIALIGGKSKK